MDPKDLLKLLDLAGTEPIPPPGESVIVPSSQEPPPTLVAHLTALEVDEWGLRRGRELVEQSERWRNWKLGEHAAADFFAAAFDPDPRLQPSCVEGRRHAFLTQLLELPDYRALHAATRLDDTRLGVIVEREQFLNRHFLCHIPCYRSTPGCAHPLTPTRRTKFHP